MERDLLSAEHCINISALFYSKGEDNGKSGRKPERGSAAEAAADR
jgi:hypothetical protein